MKLEINNPVMSKINWTALIVLAVGVANTSGMIPPIWQAHALEAATIAAPVLIIVFRSFFTEPKPEVGP